MQKSPYTAGQRRRRRRRRRLAERICLAGLGIVSLAVLGAVCFGPSLSGFRSAPPSSKAASEADPASAQAAAGAAAEEAGPPRLPAPVGSGPAAVSAAPEKPASASRSPQDHDSKVDMAFVGDILLGSTVERLLNQHGFEYPYREVLDELRPPDLTIGNLETPVSRRGSPGQKEYSYRSPPEALPALVRAGFDVVNLANNHVLDYGETALLDTLDYLDQAGLRHVGAGRDADNAFQPAVVEKNGVRIAFLGFSRVVPFVSWKAGKGHPGVADTYEETRPVQAIEQAKRDADLVVVIVHWGIEREDRPEDYQVRLARKYIDAGADLVIGGHPHVLQGLESYKGKWIAYSLGNFIFTTNSYSKTLETIILHASCTRDGDCSLKAVPVFTRWAQPKVMEPETGRKLLDRLSGISSGIRIGSDGRVLPVLPALPAR